MIGVPLNVFDISKIRPHEDNVLIRMDVHAARDERTAGGVIMPDTAERSVCYATVVAAGPGRWSSKDVWLATNPDIVPGARVVVDHEHSGQRVHSNEMEEFRMIREHNIMLVVE